MSDDNKKNEDTIRLPIWAIISSAIWVVFWIWYLVCNHATKDVGLSDLGAYISGVFAPLAWFWFVLSYYAQKQELALQRRELKLQREAIEQSVLAQQGSEDALNLEEDGIPKFKHVIKQLNENLEFTVSYSYSGTSLTDTYILQREELKHQLTKVE